MVELPYRQKRRLAKDLVEILHKKHFGPAAPDWYSVVYLFHVFNEQPHYLRTNFPNFRELDLRECLISEEYQEFMKAYADYKAGYTTMTAGQVCDAFVDMIDALGDMMVVILGTFVVFGIDPDEVFREIMLSNFSKAGLDGKPIKREDGKVLKGPNYFKPDLRQFIKE